ncbi:MAG: hypothetical protein ABEK36_04035, partial [Candidatus Aenigmatarchaeota archaeon]
MKSVIFGFLKKHIGWGILIGIILFLVYNRISDRIEDRQYENEIKYRTEYLVKQWEKDKRNYVIRAEIVDSLIGENLYLKTKIKELKYSSDSAVQDTVDSNRVRVSFFDEDKCARVSGWTITNPPEWDVSVNVKPVDLKINILDIDDENVVARIRPSNKCLRIEDAEFIVRKSALKNKKSSCWENFL